MSESVTTPAQQPKRGLLTRLLHTTLRLSVTVCFILIAAAAVYFGTSELTQRAQAVPAPDAAPPLTVSVTPIKLADNYEIERVFIGQVEAQRSVDISFELAGRLEQIRVDEGDVVSQDQVLAVLDTSLLEAEKTRLAASRDAVETQLDLAQKTVDRNSQLSERGFTSQARLDEFIARQDELLHRRSELDAALHDVNLRIDKSSIRAPFAGRVTERRVDGGETLAPGTTVLGVVEDASAQVRIGVPLDIDPAMLDTVQIEINDTRHPATLASLRPDVDPLTRTRTAIFDLNAGKPVAYGQTARLHLSETVPVTGTWIPVTALQDGTRGQWTLLVADAGKSVRSATVEVLHAQDDRVFVRGVFPADTVLIDQGPQRVTVGQRVEFESQE
ncbi:MAG: efflux RND transporter periplasmic adaptor subunit [Pseudomonadota bacterium]